MANPLTALKLVSSFANSTAGKSAAAASSSSGGDLLSSIFGGGGNSTPESGASIVNNPIANRVFQSGLPPVEINTGVSQNPTTGLFSKDESKLNNIFDEVIEPLDQFVTEIYGKIKQFEDIFTGKDDETVAEKTQERNQNSRKVQTPKEDPSKTWENDLTQVMEMITKGRM